MKIENRPQLVNLDAVKNQKKEADKSEAKSAIASAEARPADTVDTRLSQALHDVLKGIEDSGLTAGVVHSHVSSKAAERLLNESPVQAVRPQLPAEMILAMADKVAAQMLANPQAATKAFGEISGARVVELT